MTHTKTFAVAGDFYWKVSADTAKEAADKVRKVFEHIQLDDHSINEVREEA